MFNPTYWEKAWLLLLLSGIACLNGNFLTKVNLLEFSIMPLNCLQNLL